MRGEREFDGVICLGGGDWWYHNHGHYDFQMMRELSCEVPVLFVIPSAFASPKSPKGRCSFEGSFGSSTAWAVALRAFTATLVS